MASGMDTNVILIRRREVEQEIARLKSSISAMEAELVDLATAERVIARLTGAERPTVGTGHSEKSPEVSGAKPSDIPTMPQMITEVLSKAHRRGRISMTPKEIAAEIAESLWPEVQGEAVSSIVWRMWKRGQLSKHADGLYALVGVPSAFNFDGIDDESQPANEKPSDAKSQPDTSEGLSETEQQGREAGPGGGP